MFIYKIIIETNPCSEDLFYVILIVVNKGDFMNYLIYGSSFNLIDREIDKILECKTPNVYSLLDVPLNDILEDISYGSMFEEEKHLVLKNFESIFNSKKDNSLAIENLSAYLKKPNKNTTIIFTSGEKPSSRGPAKEILKNLTLIETPIITKSYELAKKFADEIKKDGYGISQNALNIFCEKCAANYDVALNEFSKLKQIKKENKLITEEDIANFVSNYNTSDMFGFKDAVINKNITKSLEMLDDLESSKMELIPLVVMLAKEYQTLYNVKLLTEKRLSNDQISSALGGMHPYRVKLLRESATKYKVDEIEHIILFLCNLDLKIVSEDNLGYDELRKLLLEL